MLFLASPPFLYPTEMLENQRILDVFKGYRISLFQISLFQLTTNLRLQLCSAR